MVITPICSVDYVISFFSRTVSQYSSSLDLIRILTLGAEENDTALVCFSAVKDL